MSIWVLLKVGQLNKSSLSEVWVVGVVLLQLRVHLRVRQDVAKIKKLFLREICKIQHFFKKIRIYRQVMPYSKLFRPYRSLFWLVYLFKLMKKDRLGTLSLQDLLYTFSPVYGPVVGEAVVVLVGPRPAAVQVGLKKQELFLIHKSI